MQLRRLNMPLYLRRNLNKYLIYYWRWMAMTDILNVRGVTKSFPGFILDNISFYLPKGYIMGLVGPNGAGKTTTIQLILNILRADSGKIELFGLDNKEYEVRIKQDIGVVFDTSFFADGWKVKD